MSGLIKWLFFESIYGATGISVAIYYLLKVVRKSDDKDNVPLVSAASVAIIGLLILPSIPMYDFESNVLATIADKPWMRVVNKSKVGSLTEPLTWFTSSIGSITIVSPGEALNPGFHVYSLTYNKKPLITLVEPECGDRIISYSKADSEGIYRADDKSSDLKMNDQEYDLYCKQDWTVEKKAINQANSNSL